MKSKGWVRYYPGKEKREENHPHKEYGVLIKTQPTPREQPPSLRQLGVLNAREKGPPGRTGARLPLQNFRFCPECKGPLRGFNQNVFLRFYTLCGNWLWSRKSRKRRVRGAGTSAGSRRWGWARAWWTAGPWRPRRREHQLDWGWTRWRADKTERAKVMVRNLTG